MQPTVHWSNPIIVVDVMQETQVMHTCDNSWLITISKMA